MSEQKGRAPRSRRERTIGSGLAGGLLGAIGGAIIGASFNGVNAIIGGAVLGGILLGLGEAITTARREEGQLKPLLYRMFVSAFLGGMIGALLGLIFKGMSLTIAGIVIGLITGIFGFRLTKFVLGIITGLLIGFIADTYFTGMNFAILGALVVFLYRVLSTLLFRGQEDLQLMAERVPESEIRYVVPLEANSKYVGANFFQELSRTKAGEFKRNLPGIGIVESMENMRGPHFDPDLVDPLIREFYEHTSHFKLNIRPEWKQRIKPLFWIFKRYVAGTIGQANLPFNTEEAQRGVVSYIDTIDFSCDDIIDLRGWVRAFEGTDEAIYVGVYTTFQHQGVGYVSVGFPLPDSNFTATLLPNNINECNLLLKSRNTGYPYPGHYLTASEGEKLTVLKLVTFDEEIEVYVEDGQLRTDHRFYLAGLNFLTLFYTMDRIEPATNQV
jgi:hypothetical protein